MKLRQRRKFLAHALVGSAAWTAWPLMAARRSSEAATPAGGGPAIWRPDHTVIVILENLSAFDATPQQAKAGDAPVFSPTSNWRFLNELAAKGTRFTNAHFTRTPYGSALPTRSSQPNYLCLFSGHHQGVYPAWFEDGRSPYRGQALRDKTGQLLKAPKATTVGVANNQIPDAWLPLRAPNLGAALMQSGRSFASFCESLPYPSWNCGSDDPAAACHTTSTRTDDYRRKHNPVINWTDVLAPLSPRAQKGDLAHHVLPLSVNLGFAPTHDPTLKQSFRGFDQDAQGKPLPFEQLPDVSIVVPNEQHDAHSNSAQVADDWLRKHLGAYAEWAQANNSLLIVTFDEDGSTDASQGDAYTTGAHRIPTLFFGAGVKQGEHAGRIDHLNVLSTVLWLHGALDRFRDDFKQFHKVVPGSGSEAALQWANLQPITDVFQQPTRGGKARR